MLIIYLLFRYSRSIKSNINCYSQNNNLDTFQKETIDYLITCPSQLIQKIDLSNIRSKISISVFKKSTVVFVCNNEYTVLPEINLLIYDEPNITFQNNCYFSNIEIYGQPILNFLDNSHIKSRNIVLDDKSLSSQFDSNYYIYKHNNTKQIFKNTLKKQYFQNEYNCKNVIISLSNNSFIKCDSNKFDLNNSEFTSFFHVIENLQIINESYNNEQIKNILEKIFPFLLFEKETTVIFTDLFDIINFNQIFETFKFIDSEILINMTWSRYLVDDSNCAWENEKYIQDYMFLENTFNWLIENSWWRKICFGNEAYLYINDNSDVFKISVPKIGLDNISFILLVICIIFLFLAVFIIVKHKSSSLLYNSSSIYSSSDIGEPSVKFHKN